MSTARSGRPVIPGDPACRTRLAATARTAQSRTTGEPHDGRAAARREAYAL